MIPAARHAFTVARYHVSPPVPPQELLTTCGRSDVLPPGASTHWPDASRCEVEQVSQPRAAIHVAPGATPMALPAPSSPIMVPMVCVPCPFVSHGAEHAPVGSYHEALWS